jgi:pimeloyl-ACP methyl ester carboxylesterase
MDPEPIVLLHGTSSSLHTWDGWVQHLVPSRRVIRMDLPAFGLTGPHPNNDYAINAYVQFVSSVLKALNVHSFVLAGNSLGGHIAWSYALSKPLEVKKLILVDAAGYAMQSRSVPIAFQLARVPGFSFVLQHVLPRSVVESSLRNVYGNPTKVSEELIDRYYDLALRKGNRSALFKRMQTPAIADSSLIASIKLPVLVLWGGKDQLIPLENAYRFASDIRGATLVVFEGLGHVPHEEDPDLTVKAVQQFLQR